MQNLKIIEYFFNNSYFLSVVNKCYEHFDFKISLLDFIYSKMLNPNFFSNEILPFLYHQNPIDCLTMDIDKLLIFKGIFWNVENESTIVLDIKDFILTFYEKEKIDKLILKKFFNRVDSNILIGNEQLFIDSLEFKKWDDKIIILYLNFNPEMKQMNMNQKTFNIWKNICEYQNVKAEFIKRFVPILKTKKELCYLLKNNNSNLFKCDQTTIRQILAQANK